MSNFTSDEQKRQLEFSDELNLAAMMAVKRYAEATAEHCKTLSELQKIAASRVNADPVYSHNNLHQQAGKSAEVKHVARSNANSIIDGKGPRIARTDNVGFVNHEEFDFTRIDPVMGTAILGQDGALMPGGQMKVHKDIAKYRDHYKKNFDKYERAELVVPHDQFGAIVKDWADEQQSLTRQRDKLLSQGKNNLAKQLQGEIDQIKDAGTRLKQSPVSSSDAMEARISPSFSVVKDVLKISHRAGLEAARSSAAIGGGMSLVSNVAAVVKSGKPLDEAAFDVCKDAGSAAAGAYVGAATSSVIGGCLQSANNQIMQNLGRSNAPAMAVQVAATMGKNVIELACGRMKSEEFVRNVTKDGCMLAVSMTGSNLGAILGTAVFPGVGTLVGGLVGGMIASMLGGNLHSELMQSVASMDASNTLREQTRVICLRIKEQHEAYQLEMHAAFDAFFSEKSQSLKQGFDLISTAAADGQSIHAGLSCIATAMNTQLAFNSRDEFSRHLNSGTVLAF